MLLFRNEGPPGALIDRVDPWDGPNRIQSSPVNWVGDRSGAIDLVPEKDGSYGGNVLPVSNGAR
jgi:hypothetical protein